MCHRFNYNWDNLCHFPKYFNMLNWSISGATTVCSVLCQIFLLSGLVRAAGLDSLYKFQCHWFVVMESSIQLDLYSLILLSQVLNTIVERWMVFSGEHQPVQTPHRTPHMLLLLEGCDHLSVIEEIVLNEWELTQNFSLGVLIFLNKLDLVVLDFPNNVKNVYFHKIGLVRW